jgi:hypothetical protein
MKQPDVSRLLALLKRGPRPGPQLQGAHHLTNNRGVGWVTLTANIHGRRVRIERSLRTTDLSVARERRDELIDLIAAQPGAYVVLRERRRG